MKHILTFLSIAVVLSTTNIQFSYATVAQTKKQDTPYSNDTIVKKYDVELAQLYAEMLKIQEKYTSVTKLRNERIAKLAPKETLKDDKRAVSTSTGSMIKPIVFNKVPDPKNLEDFPLATTTWRTRFYQTGAPPLNTFKAFYFNTSQPAKVVASADVASVNISYAYERGPGFTIASEDFGGYWIGDFLLTKDEEMVLEISQSRSEARVIIDGRLIYKGTGEAPIKILIPKGRHTIEIEYVNSWHTVKFTASLRTLTDVPKTITANEIKNIEHGEVWYAGVYESGGADGTIRLIPKSNNGAPKILILSSYSVVKWDASLLKNTGIKAIIYSGSSPGSEIINVPQGVAVYTGTIPYGYTLKASCQTNDRIGLLGCDSLDQFTIVHKAITALTTKPLTGFTGTYSSKELTLPGTILTSEIIKDALANPVKLREESKKFLESKKIDNIF